MSVYNIIASVLSGFIGSMGMGGGGILIIYLTGILDLPQLYSQGINLLVFIPTAVTAIIRYIKLKIIDFSRIKELYYLILPGAIAGFYLTQILNKNISGKVFGAFLLITGLIELFKKAKSHN